MIWLKAGLKHPNGYAHITARHYSLGQVVDGVEPEVRRLLRAAWYDQRLNTSYCALPPGNAAPLYEESW